MPVSASDFGYFKTIVKATCLASFLPGLLNFDIKSVAINRINNLRSAGGNRTFFSKQFYIADGMVHLSNTELNALECSQRDKSSCDSHGP